MVGVQEREGELAACGEHVGCHLGLLVLSSGALGLCRAQVAGKRVVVGLSPLDELAGASAQVDDGMPIRESDELPIGAEKHPAFKLGDGQRVGGHVWLLSSRNQWSGEEVRQLLDWKFVEVCDYVSDPCAKRGLDVAFGEPIKLRSDRVPAHRPCVEALVVVLLAL